MNNTLPDSKDIVLYDGKMVTFKCSDRQSKQSVAYEYLKTSIITGKLPPEKQLVERDICEKLGLSRTPVREAFRQLSSEGLVDFTPGKGVIVVEMTMEKARQMYELKEALETMAARLSAEKASEEDLEQMRQCLERHRTAYENKQFSLAVDIDIHFHILLLKGSKNPLIERYAKSILGQTRRLAQLSVYDADKMDRFIAQHQKIYDAIAMGDGEGAAKAVGRHIAFVEKFQCDRWRMLF